MNEQRRRGFLIPISLVTRAAKEGISLAELQHMVNRSARFTHPEGNRRYHDYLFLIEGRKLMSFQKVTEEEADEEVFYKCETCKDAGTVPVFDVCEHCDGAGCKHCDAGLVRNTIPCPACTLKKEEFQPHRARRRG